MFKSRVFPLTAAFAVLTLLDACSSASGPTYDVQSITGINGHKYWRINCQGLFENDMTCMKKAQEVCGDAQVAPIDKIAPYSTDGDKQATPSAMTFQCVVPVAATPTPSPRPAPAPAPAPAPVRKLALKGDALFAFNSATLSAQGKQTLDELITAFKGVPVNSIAISGYTDSVGSDAYNQKLSEARARSVADYLSKHGFHASQEDAHGFGRASPVATNDTAEGRARNRRVEIIVRQ